MYSVGPIIGKSPLTHALMSLPKIEAPATPGISYYAIFGSSKNDKTQNDYVSNFSIRISLI